MTNQHWIPLDTGQAPTYESLQQILVRMRGEGEPFPPTIWHLNEADDVGLTIRNADAAGKTLALLDAADGLELQAEASGVTVRPALTVLASDSTVRLAVTLDGTDARRRLRVYGATGNLRFSADDSGIVLGTNVDLTGTLHVTEAVSLDSGLTVDTPTLVVDRVNHRVGVGTTSPGFKLDVNGTQRVTGAVTMENTLGVTDVVTAGGLTVDTNTLHVDRVNHRVGVGTTTPGAFKLDVSGSQRVTVDLTVGNALGVAGAVTCSTLLVDTSVLVVDPAANRVGVNTGAPTVDLDVVGAAKVSANFTADSPTLHVDAVNHRVGVGTTTPGVQVELTGALKVGGASTFVGAVVADTSTLVVDAVNHRVGVGTGAPTVALDVVGAEVVSGALTVGGALVVDTSTLVVDATGNKVGIGTGAPSAVLDVASGNIRVSGNATQPASGAGLEMLYRTSTSVGVVMAYDRTGAVYKDLEVDGLSVSLLAGGTSKLKVNSTGIGFNATAPVAKPTLAAAASDLATVITLANDIRTRLINYGLAA